MNKSLVEQICCPRCKGYLRLTISAENSEEVLSGEFACVNCQESYSIQDGVAHLISTPGFESELANESAFFEAFLKKHNNYKVYKEDDYVKINRLLGLERIDKKAHLLSLGIGLGAFEEYLLPMGHTIVGIDISREFLKRSMIPGLQADIRNLPLKDNLFDGILCMATLHHIKPTHYAETIKEMYRVLKRGGRIYLFEPNHTFRSKFLLPLARFLHMATAGEAYIQLSSLLPTMESCFTIEKVEKIKAITYTAIPQWLQGTYQLTKLLFDLIPFTEKDEFFIVVAKK